MGDNRYAKVLDVDRGRHRNDLNGDEMPDQEIAEQLPAAGANRGMPQVKRFLHRAVNVLRRRAPRSPTSR